MVEYIEGWQNHLRDAVAKFGPAVVIKDKLGTTYEFANGRLLQAPHPEKFPLTVTRQRVEVLSPTSIETPSPTGQAWMSHFLQTYGFQLVNSDSLTVPSNTLECARCCAGSVHTAQSVFRGAHP